jgi:hypothetical protein
VPRYSHTNFQHLTPAIADQILDEGLLDVLLFNIDGCTKDRYEAMKHLSFDTVMAHVQYCWEKRNAIGSPMAIRCGVIPYTGYMQTMKKLGIIPLRDAGLTPMDPWAEMRGVQTLIDPWFKPGQDGLHFQNPIGWAERSQFDGKAIDYTDLTCPMFPRVKSEAFIAPDGTWYACCFDPNNDLALGNVLETSVYEVATSAARRDLITKLELGMFADIGGPCRTVNCCQPIAPV